MSNQTRVTYALALPRGWWELVDGESSAELATRMLEGLAEADRPDAAHLRASLDRVVPGEDSHGSRIWVHLPHPACDEVDGVFSLRFFRRDDAEHLEYLDAVHDAYEASTLRDRTIAEYDEADRSIAVVHDILLSERDDDPTPVTSRATLGVFPKSHDVVLEVGLMTHDVVAFSDLPGYALSLARTIDFSSR